MLDNTKKTMKVKILYPCRIAGISKKPGDIVEGPESEMQELVSNKRATLDLGAKLTGKGRHTRVE